MTQTLMPLESVALNGAHVFTFPRYDLLDLECMQVVRDRISELLKTESRPKIVLDLGNVMLLTSDGIALIVSLRHAIRPLGADIHVANLTPQSQAVFEHLCLERLVRIFPTTESAIAAFR